MEDDWKFVGPGSGFTGVAIRKEVRAGDKDLGVTRI